MNKPVDEMGLPPVLAEMAQAAVDICGDDPHRDGVPAAIVKLLEEAFKNPRSGDGNGRTGCSWGKKEAVGGGKFEAVGAENEPGLLPSLVKRV